MNVVVISPEADRPDEIDVVIRLFAAGLQRYHVRKPHASAAELEAWLKAVPPECRSRLVLHQHHALVEKYALGGRHWKDAGSAAAVPPVFAPGEGGAGGWTSRSCHDLGALRATFGVYDSVFFGPVFASVSKPGYGPKDAQVGEALIALLNTRSNADRRTSVLALGGITVATAARALGLGFDGVAVLGTVWQSDDPVRAFREVSAACANAIGGQPRAVHPGPLLMRGAARLKEMRQGGATPAS